VEVIKRQAICGLFTEDIPAFKVPYVIKLK
jgi:hypothetical protein